ncbi:MAG: hypothetical protein BGO54_07825 [Sphingobacteriales bacterium 46-32]|nr:MAG: hypothetical protein BGO54_07825 [Sphingobacteriales bacterium 46-32]
MKKKLNCKINYKLTRLFLVITATLFINLSTKAQVELPTDIFNKADKVITVALGSLRNTGDYLVNHSINELSVLLGTARQILGDQVNVAMDRLSTENRKIMERISELIHQIEEGRSNLVSLVDNLVLDINQILGNTLIGEKQFIIRKISGFNHLVKEAGDYSFVIIASNIGYNTDNDKTSFVKFVINDKTDITNQVKFDNSLDQHTRVIKLPGSVINTFKNDEAPVPIKVTFAIVKTMKKGFLFKKLKTSRIENSFYLYLFPRLSTELQTEAFIEESNWVKLNARKSLTATGPNAHCRSGCRDWNGIPFSIEFSVVGGNEPPKLGDQRLSNPKIEPAVGNIRGFDVINPPIVDNGGIHAIVNITARTHPNPYILSADVEEFTSKGVVHKKDKLKIFYDEVYELVYPKEIKFLRLNGRLVYNNEIFNYSIDEPNPVFQLVNDFVIAGEKHFIIRVKRPFK